MASIEFITKRMEGKEKEVEKLEQKLVRIEKAKESDYKENNPYGYNDYDLFRTQRELDNARATLNQYRSLMAEVNNKAARRNIPVITQFLNDWEERMVKYFLDEYIKYEGARDQYNIEDKMLCDEYNSCRDAAKRKKISGAMKEHSEKFRQAWSHVTAFDHGNKSWEETMRSDIAKEKDDKYDSLIERVTHITGKITDASNLRIGHKGDINGYIIGENGKASVNTIDAGGYNIQCYHFRTLVHKMDKTERVHEKIRKFEILANEKEIKKVVSYTDPDDLLDTLKKHIDYLINESNDPLGWQQGILKEIDVILKNIQIEK